MNIKKKIIRATPARPPTTPPAIAEAGGVDEESELVPSPAAAVLVEALPVVPVPPPATPPPDVGVALEPEDKYEVE